MRQAAWLALVAFAAVGAPAPALANATAIFAGGCFWCLEADFDKVQGVTATELGYIGGAMDAPSYRDVSAQTTGHYEAVRVTFDPEVVPYRRLLVVFWLSIDPTDATGQFCDRGDSKRAAIFPLDDDQRAQAEAMRIRAQAVLGRPVVTPVLEAGRFWPAEERHQDYAERNPLRYDFYRRSCGRDAGLRAIWGGRPLLAGDAP